MYFDYSLLIPEYFLIAWAFVVIGVYLFFPRLLNEVPSFLAAFCALVGLVIFLFYIDFYM